jgi:tetratricopeptide (TPR) repeat protein
LFTVGLCWAATGVSAQSPSADPSKTAEGANASSNASAAPGAGGNASGGLNLLKMFDPQSGNVTWQGKSFGLGESKAQLTRFERYLVTPAANGEADLAYSQTLEEISDTLKGRKGGTVDQRVADAWRLLYKAADYEGDSRLSETLANSLISHWQTNVRVREILRTNKELERSRANAESNIVRTRDSDRNLVLESIRNNTSASSGPPTRDYAVSPHEKRLTEAEQKIAENIQLETSSRLNQKLEFQGLILQLFAQRRFQHVLIALDFYRYLFPGEQGNMEGGDALKQQFLGDMDVKLTTSGIEALTREAIREVDFGSQAVNHLLSRGEIYGASLRLMEVFHLGEFLPVVKTFPIEQKDQLRASVQGMVELTTALEAKDFDRASTLIDEIKAKVPDFDSVKPNAMIVAAKQVSALSLQRAGLAAKSGDMKAAEEAIKMAMEAWPSNPAITKFSTGVEQRADVVNVAASDFDRLIGNGELRSIFRDRFRFAAALHDDAERNKLFTDVMKRMEQIETALAQSQELQRTKNELGAWEIVERAYRAFPDDLQINRARSDLAVKASAFAALIARADTEEMAGQRVSALLAYLDAKEKYPASYFADEGIARLTGEILDGRAGATAPTGTDSGASGPTLAGGDR